MKRYYQNNSVILDPDTEPYIAPSINLEIVARGNQATCVQDSTSHPTVCYSAVSDLVDEGATPDPTLHNELRTKFTNSWNSYAEMIAWITTNVSESLAKNSVDQIVSGE